MEYVQQERRTGSSSPVTIGQRMRELDDKINQLTDSLPKEKTKEFKWPWKFNWKFKQNEKKIKNDQILVWYLNNKQQIEVPQFMPVQAGNVIIYKNKSYEYNPADLWTMQGIKGGIKCYLIREGDKRPVSNRDMDEVKARGDSTDADEILVKQWLEAKTKSSITSKSNMMIGIIVIVVIAGGLIWFLNSGIGQ